MWHWALPLADTWCLAPYRTPQAGGRARQHRHARHPAARAPRIDRRAAPVATATPAGAATLSAW